MVGVFVAMGVSVADGVAVCATCEPDAKIEKSCEILWIAPDALVPSIVIVCSPVASGVVGLYDQFPFGDERSCAAFSPSIKILTMVPARDVPENCGRLSTKFWFSEGLKIWTLFEIVVSGS